MRVEAEEINESFDTLAGIINDYYDLKSDLVKVEAEVYEFGRIIQSMPQTRADKFKSKLWLAWF